MTAVMKAAKKTVLVVCNDPSLSTLLTDLIDQEGTVISRQNATEALAFLESQGCPDAVVADLHLSGIDGWQFCRLLRSSEYAAFNRTPILVVSAILSMDQALEVTRELGANAFLSLPCPPAELKEALQAVMDGRPITFRPKVLIVEDSPTMAHLLQKAFHHQGYTAATATTGKEARRLYQDLLPDLVILDHHLPDLYGDELLREFKQFGNHPAVIMITADTSLCLATRFMSLGANGYIHKPFDLPYLIEMSKKVRRERALTRIEDILKERTAQLQKAYTKLQEKESRLRASKEELHSLVSNLPALVFTGYADGSVAFFDDKIQELTGYSRIEFATRQRVWAEVILPEDLQQAQQIFIEALKGNKSYVREYRIHKKNGEILWIQERSCIFLRPDGSIADIRGIFFDISERQRQEEERLKLDRLGSLGLLAGGIAHDFNNLLTAVLGNVNLVAQTTDLSEEIRASLFDAELACLRAQDLSRQLLTFSKGGTPIKKVVPLFPLLRETISLSLAGSNCRTSVALAPDLLHLEVDPGQTTQVLHNILLNAQQAMPEGGEISVRAANVVIHAESALPLSPGHYVEIAIKDEGRGIDPACLSRIFDPYFTTKDKGQGLGLATAYSIVEKHGGHIAVISSPGHGTTFTIHLPAAAQFPTMEAPREPLAIAGKGRILVMDDDPLVRQVTGKMLRHLGYQVEYAEDGSEALTKCAQALDEGRPFRVVILDLTVPGGLGGQETMLKLREMDPNIRGIVNSGYANNSIMTQYREFGFCGYIRKPYRVKELSEELAVVLSDCH